MVTAELANPYTSLDMNDELWTASTRPADADDALSFAAYHASLGGLDPSWPTVRCSPRVVCLRPAARQRRASSVAAASSCRAVAIAALTR